MKEILIADTSFDSWVKRGELYVCTEESCFRVKNVLKPEILVSIRLIMSEDKLVIQGKIIAIEMKSLIGTKVVIEGTLQNLSGVDVDARSMEVVIGKISTAPLNTYNIAS